MNRRRCGFTLIELLVVIAIIAILAAILFPIFAAARRSAQLASCQSSMKQLGIAIRMYADDNGGRLMRYENLLPQAQRLMWWDFIDRYLKAGEIYQCPALKIENTNQGFGPHNRHYSFGLNANLCWSILDPTPSAPASGNWSKIPKVDSLPRPSALLVLADAYTINATSGAPEGFPVVYPPRVAVPRGDTPGQYRKDGNVSNRHRGNSDILYADGHVKTHPHSYVIQNYTTLAGSLNNDIWGEYDNLK